MNGVIVKEENINGSGSHSIDVSKLANGLYLLRIDTPKGAYSGKIIVQE